ncbi:MAG: hypothetical protein M1813_001393 [Trichoglossum hirsutum]|nr:MAG: hypothetical protein M1813_001393 [Trichoglossum hirsutum]
MTTNLPKGFVTNSESIPGDIERIDTVDVEEIFKLWKVYTTNKNVLQNDVGLRLENLFWRIWGSDRIRANIKGSALAKHFIRISRAQTSKQNTFLQSPHSRRGLSEIQPVREARNPPTPPSSLLSSLQRIPSPHLDQRYGQVRSQASLEVLPVPPVQQSPSASLERPKVTVPPPILKRFRGNATESLFRVTTQAVREESDSSISPAIDIAPRPPTPPKPRRDSAGGAKRKRTSFVASTVSTRRKPGLVKRKLSQSSAADHASPLALPHILPLNQDGREPGSREFTATQTSLISKLSSKGSRLSPWDDGIGVDLKGARIRPALKPGSVDISRQTQNEQKLKGYTGAEHSNSDSRRPNPEVSGDGEYPKADWLVERDFRSKFVDKRRQERFSFLLGHPSTSKTGPTLAQSSMEATATIESGENSTTKVLTRGKKVIVVDDVVPLKTEGLPPHQSLGGDDEPLAPLPRTKSQLTFLLERDRALKAQEKQKTLKTSS